MKDIQIIEQLLNGNHLEPKEVKRASQILYNLRVELHSRQPKDAFRSGGYGL